MGVQLIPIVVVTGFWGIVGIVCPLFLPIWCKSSNRGIIQVALMMTAASCWLFWLCCYMAQMNPLIGPTVSRNVLFLMAEQWGNITEA